jgi:hypothetical protein
MRVKDHLYYFATPRCASEFFRFHLDLEWDNEYDPFYWLNSSINYCHVQPARYVAHHNLTAEDEMFSLVRNPFDKIVSTWTYGTKHGLEYAKGRSFPRFVQYMYENRNAPLDSLPMTWMHMSACNYFGDVIDSVRFFDFRQIGDCCAWLSRKHGIRIESTEKINSTVHDHYSAYYDEHTKTLVHNLYRDDIDRFGFSFETLQQEARRLARSQRPQRRLRSLDDE